MNITLKNSSVGTAISYGVTAAITSLCVMAAWTTVAPSRDRASETCLSNLRQLGLMSRVYADDYGGCLVPYVALDASGGKRYSQLLTQYRNSPDVFRCPLDHLSRSGTNVIPGQTTYGVNWYLSGMVGTFTGVAMLPKKYSSIKDPGGTIWAADTAVILLSTAALPPSGWKEDLVAAPKADIYFFYLPKNAETGTTDISWSSTNYAGQIVRPFPRHTGFVNSAFYDGHAAPVPQSQFDPSITQWGKPGCLWDNVAG